MSTDIKEESSQQTFDFNDSQIADAEVSQSTSLTLPTSIDESSQLNATQPTNETLDTLLNDHNYAVILEFLSKFGEHLQLEQINFKNFENYLLNKSTIHRKLLDLQINLLKKLPFGRNAKKDKWQHYLARFACKYSKTDGKCLNENGYCESDIHVKTRLLKNLLECQFDDNIKLRQVISELEPCKLRFQASGRDFDAYDYWIFIDKEFTIRIFTQHSEDSNGLNWKIIVKNLDELKQLFQQLSTHTCMERFKNKEKEVKIEQNDIKIEENLKIEQVETLKEAQIQSKVEKDNAKEYDQVEMSVKLEEDKIKNEKEENQMIKNKTNDTENHEKVIKEVKSEEKVDKKQVKTTSKIDDDLFEPIALRRTKRTSAIKKPYHEDICTTSNAKSTPKSSSTKKIPQVKSSSKNKNIPHKRNKSASDEENSIDDDDDDIPLAKLKKKRMSDDDFRPSLNTSRNKKTCQNSENEEMASGDEESTCKKCLKFKEKELLLLCDGCDDAYHFKCLTLGEIPEGNWYCNVCDHKNLCTKLKEKIDVIEAHHKQLEALKTQSIKNRSNRIADIGANLDSMFQNKPQKKQARSPRVKSDRPRVQDIFVETENLGTRSCRLKNKIKYTFEDYDRSMKEAMGSDEDVEENTTDKIHRKKRSIDSDDDFETRNGHTHESKASDDNDDEVDEEEDTDSDKVSDLDEYVPKTRRKSKRVVKRRRYSDDDDFEIDESVIQSNSRRSDRRKNKNTYCELSDSDANDDELYASKTNKRNESIKRKDSDYESEHDEPSDENSEEKEEIIFKPRKTPNTSRIKRPIDSESESEQSRDKKKQNADEDDESWKSDESEEKLQKKRPVKSIIKKPWENDDTHVTTKITSPEQDDKSQKDDEDTLDYNNDKPQLPAQLSTYGSKTSYMPDSYQPFEAPSTQLQVTNILSTDTQAKSTMQTFNYSEQNQNL